VCHIYIYIYIFIFIYISIYISVEIGSGAESLDATTDDVARHWNLQNLSRSC